MTSSATKRKREDHYATVVSLADCTFLVFKSTDDVRTFTRKYKNVMQQTRFCPDKDSYKEHLVTESQRFWTIMNAEDHRGHTKLTLDLCGGKRIEVPEIEEIRGYK